MAAEAIALQPVRPRSIRTGAAWTLGGSLVAAAASWGSVILLARLGRPETVGEFTLVYSLAAPAFMLAGLQLRALLATDAGRRTPLADYWGIRLASTGAALLVLFVLMSACGYGAATLAVGAAVVVAKAFESLSDLVHGIYQQRNRMDCLGASVALRGLASLGTLGGLYWYSGNLLLACAGLALVSAGAFVCDLRQAKRLDGGESFRPRFSPSSWRHVLRFAFPLGVTMLLISLQINLPRLLIERWVGRGDLGIFAALAWVTMAGGLLVQALGTAASPRLAAAHVRGDRVEFRKLGTNLLLGASGLGLLACGAAAGFGDRLLHAVYGPDYGVHGSLFVWLAAAAGVSWVSSALGYAATASRRIRLQPAAQAMTVIVLLAGCWLLVPGFGLAGAGWAIFAAAVVQVAAFAGLFLVGGARG
ncbi:MAG: lipopolysaccharide biosynthesis protein [Bryobacterales bacterium]|nr:lipopolysaccharide biosynthesis protein [Bryobacterales bacterium]